MNGIHNKARGEKAWPPLVRFKALLLQSWYTLSGPQLEKQLAQDLLFRRFVGLDIAENMPGHSKLWRFRQKLMGGRWKARLKEINDQLSSRQLYIKAGEISIVDANSEGKQKTTYGYKAHVVVEEDGFIKPAHSLQATCMILSVSHLYSSGKNRQCMQTVPTRAPNMMPYWQKRERRTAF